MTDILALRNQHVLERYASSNLLVAFDYDGKRPDLYRRRITVDDVRWATALLTGLNDRQWRDAFRAGGYPADLSDRFIQKIKTNILQGQRVAADQRAMLRGKR